MGTATPQFLDRLRQPEYTGENRCIPCTVVNVAITLAVSGALWFIWEPLAVAFLVVGVGAIYFRGYLVPGTPTLTKRYFPDRVLRWFDKAPAEDAPMAGSEADLDPEPILMEAGAVELCQGGEDLCATEAFAAAWREEMDALRSDDGLVDRIASLVGVDAETVAINEQADFCSVRADGQPIARWESRAALIADMAAVPELERRFAGWGDLGLREKGRLLNGMRVFLEACPDCGGDVEFSRDTVESCCREIDVVAMSCADCDSLLLEVEADV